MGLDFFSSQDFLLLVLFMIVPTLVFLSRKRRCTNDNCSFLVDPALPLVPDACNHHVGWFSVSSFLAILDFCRRCRFHFYVDELRLLFLHRYTEYNMILLHSSRASGHVVTIATRGLLDARERTTRSRSRHDFLSVFILSVIFFFLLFTR